MLPSGRFAQIRPITWLDRAVAWHANHEIWILCVAGRVVSIDGVQANTDQLGAFELAEANPIIEIIGAEMADSLKSKGVL